MTDAIPPVNQVEAVPHERRAKVFDAEATALRLVRCRCSVSTPPPPR